jgi:hypothetical protein
MSHPLPLLLLLLLRLLLLLCREQISRWGVEIQICGRDQANQRLAACHSLLR